MQYKRILILGCKGNSGCQCSGKTTFARRLGDVTGLPVVHLDKLFWKPGWVQPTRQEFYLKLEAVLTTDKWIIDGNYDSSLPLRLPYADLVIYLDVPRYVSMWGIFSRYLKNKGKTRPDMADGCPDKIDREFVSYTWHFQKDKGAGNKALVRDSGKTVVWLRTRREAGKYLEAYAHADA